ncbi:MAG: amidohydrolase [Burkholderiaceae bacterium]|nr:amidohydrolase [Burkholderiaceae bacterium]
MKRRHWLACCGGAALGAGLFTSLGARAWRNACRGPLPADLAADELVAAALDGLDPTRLVDTHAHLLGTGDAGSGCRIHPHLTQAWHPVEHLRRRAILNGACVAADAPSIDTAYVDRLVALAAEFPAGARWWLFAFDEAHDDDGRMRHAWTTFHVPDRWAATVAARHPAHFDWVASVHPYRADAAERLDAALAAGAVALKWLPSAMNIDLADARCRPLYDRLARAGRPLIVHCGAEHAVPGAGRQGLGNPLAVRHPLARGTPVIVAHCASLGRMPDTDRRSAPQRPAFELFARLMDEGHDRLFGDISAVFQRNRGAEVWRTLLRREAWHGRLLHGSDHPLPGVVPLFSLPALQRAGLLADDDAPVLDRLRHHNPLLFDLVLQRRLRDGTARLPTAVFEARALDLLRLPR